MRARILHPYLESFAELPIEVLGVPSAGHWISVELMDCEKKYFEVLRVLHQCSHDVEEQNIEADELILYCKVIDSVPENTQDSES